MLGQGLQDDRPFDLLPGFLEGQASVAVAVALQLQVGGGDPASFGHDDGAFDVVFQFPDISRPGVRLQGADGRLRKAGYLFLQLPGEPLQKGVRQQEGIALTLPQGREAEGDHADPVV